MTNVPPPAGWYLDPRTGAANRWWDGTAWTETYTPLAPVGTPQLQRDGKSMSTTYLLAIFLGGFGIHRFYLGRPVSALILLALTLVAVTTGTLSESGSSPLFYAVWIWTIVDLFLIPGMVRSTRNRA
ncbi:NINE protein [Cryobacterium frigoriphilum]|uniref:NINE protein n=1 Tax=Cryobacterium frigoriphilum TaxID=1259150 RepID=A0A4R8ZV42_9MICO|nr:NINE protein [Cryobacterium frigoriphilum]